MAMVDTRQQQENMPENLQQDPNAHSYLSVGSSPAQSRLSGASRALTTTSHYQGPTSVSESRTTNYTTQVGSPQYSTKETYNTYGSSTATMQTSGVGGTVQQSRNFPASMSYRAGEGTSTQVKELATSSYSTAPVTTTSSYQQAITQPTTTSYQSGGVTSTRTYQSSPTTYQSSPTTVYQSGTTYQSGGVTGVTQRETTTTTQQQGAVVSTTTGASYYGASRIVTGEERVIGYNTIVQEDRIISERIVEHEVKVPKKVVREEVIEKIYIVPETIIREEIIEEIQKIQETIVEVAKPVVQEKVVEVPEIEYREKIVEKVEKKLQEKVVEVPKIEYQERVVEVPRITYQEKIMEVPEIEYRDVVIEKIMEVPEVRDQVVVKEVPVPQYVDRQVPEYVNVEIPVDTERTIPVPVEAITTFEYQLAQFRPRVNKVQYPLYVPRFVEVPVCAELFDPAAAAQLQAQAAKLRVLTSPQAMGLCDIENLATDLRRADGVTAQSSSMDLRSALTNAWNSGRLSTRGAGGAMVNIVPMQQTLVAAAN